jgi:hypothetical protein
MSQPQTQDRFRRIVEAARNREGAAGVDTMIVSSHLAQMRLFMMRQGIEFFPRQDTYGFRKSFLAKVIEENEIDARLEGVVDDFISEGKGLWFFRPVRDSYRIMWFSKENYRAYYDAQEEIEEIDLIYSFRVREGLGAIAMQNPRRLQPAVRAPAGAPRRDCRDDQQGEAFFRYALGDGHRRSEADGA